ncbi:MAG: MarR family transcriptional regulator [Lachnospiraceae bacterium]|nr:MarR family transcriptional regulator [Lachnospiraceae bacterium]
MDIQTAKEVIDSFHEAKRVWERLPELPEGIVSSHITTLDAIMALSDEGKDVCVSDISSRMKLPRPGVTRTLNHMEELGLIRREGDPNDRRITHIRATGRGKELYRTYVEEYFTSLSQKMGNIDPADIRIMIDTIYAVSDALKEERDR